MEEKKKRKIWKQKKNCAKTKSGNLDKKSFDKNGPNTQQYSASGSPQNSKCQLFVSRKSEGRFRLPVPRYIFGNCCIPKVEINKRLVEMATERMSRVLRTDYTSTCPVKSRSSPRASDSATQPTQGMQATPSNSTAAAASENCLFAVCRTSGSRPTR